MRVAYVLAAAAMVGNAIWSAAAGEFLQATVCLQTAALWAVLLRLSRLHERLARIERTAIVISFGQDEKKVG